MEQIANKRQVVIDKNERHDLYTQFEDMFVAADDVTSGNSYSGAVIKARYPKVWELFRLACL